MTALRVWEATLVDLAMRVRPVGGICFAENSTRFIPGMKGSMKCKARLTFCTYMRQ